MARNKGVGAPVRRGGGRNIVKGMKFWNDGEKKLRGCVVMGGMEVRVKGGGSHVL